MKLLLIVFSFISIQLSGQFIEPDFIFKIVGEDSKGNKDTVLVGYHPNSLSFCNLGDLDPRFDNEDISDIKWTKPFEMRMMNTLQHSDVGLAKSSKNIIVPYSYVPETCNTIAYKQYINTEYGQLYIKCMHPPFTLTWDTTVFNNNACAANSFMVLNTLNNYTIAYTDPGAYRNKSELKSSGMLIDSAKLNIHFKYPDNTTETLDAHYVIGFASAAAKFIVGTKESDIGQVSTIYPNPGHEKIYIYVGEEYGASIEVEVKIVSILGQEIRKKAMLSGTIIEVDVRDLVAGAYVAIVSVGSKRISGRFVKE